MIGKCTTNFFGSVWPLLTTNGSQFIKEHLSIYHTREQRDDMQSLNPLNEISDSLTRARSAPTKSYGITFTKAKREEKNYQSLMSPGPIYAGYDVHNILHKSVSVPKSKRVSVFDEIPLLNVSPGPAAPYNPAAPKSKAIVSFPKTKRFIDEELRHRDSKLTPGNYPHIFIF